jgi:hypothetical protein
MCESGYMEYQYYKYADHREMCAENGTEVRKISVTRSKVSQIT